MPPPEGVKFGLAAPLKAAPEAYAALVKDYSAEIAGPFIDQTFQELTAAFCDLAGIDSPCFDRVAEVLSWYYGDVPLEQQGLWELCWRICCGAAFIRSGGRLVKEFRSVAPFWSGVRFDDVWYGRSSRSGMAQYDISFRVLDGQFAGLVFKQLIPCSFVLGRLARNIGFPMFKPLNRGELVQAVFVGMVDAANPRFPRVTEFYASASTKSWNSQLRRARARPCCDTAAYSWLCHECFVGYGPLNSKPCFRARRVIPPQSSPI